MTADVLSPRQRSEVSLITTLTQLLDSKVVGDHRVLTCLYSVLGWRSFQSDFTLKATFCHFLSNSWLNLLPQMSGKWANSRVRGSEPECLQMLSLMYSEVGLMC